MDVFEWNAIRWKDTGDDQSLEEIVRGLLTENRRGRFCNMDMLVRRLERAIKVIDDSRAAIEPSNKNGLKIA